MSELERELRDLLTKFRYTSSRSPQWERSLQHHHIDALVLTLLPFVRHKMYGSGGTGLYDR